MERSQARSTWPGVSQQVEKMIPSAIADSLCCARRFGSRRHRLSSDAIHQSDRCAGSRVTSAPQLNNFASGNLLFCPETGLHLSTASEQRQARPTEWGRDRWAGCGSRAEETLFEQSFVIRALSPATFLLLMHRVDASIPSPEVARPGGKKQLRSPTDFPLIHP